MIFAAPIINILVTYLTKYSKLRANSSKRATKNKKQYEKWQSHLLEDIASIEKEIAAGTDEQEPESLKKN